MSSRSRTNVFQTLNVERLTCDYLHLNNTSIRVNGYPFGTADLANTANFITAESLQQSDWLTVNPNSATFIKNKPGLSKVALSGKFTDLSDAPSLVPVNADWAQQDPTELSFVRNKPTVSKAGSSGLYSDLVAGSGQPVVPTSVDYNAASSTATTLAITGKPVIPAPQINSDWAVSDPSSLAFIRSKPDLSAVALSGAFADLVSKPVVYQTVDWNASGNSGTTLAIANRPIIPPAPVNADWNAPSGPAAILNRPVIPDSQVNSDWNANTGPAAILNKPRLPADQINSDWLATQGSVAYIANRPQLGKVALSDDYNDLKNPPAIPEPQKPSDWSAVSGPTFIQNKPVFAAVATSGNYSDILANSGQPVIPSAVDWSLSASTSSTLAVKNRPQIPAAQVQSDWRQTDNLQISFIQGKPILAAVALSGSYNDLTNKPTTSSGVAQSDWTQPDSAQPSYINHKPVLGTVATTGKYSDLVANSGQPSAVTAADWNATAASGSIIPVVNKPSIPAAQVNADWNSTSGLSQIYNQPVLAPVALSNQYTDLSNRPAFGAVATSNLYSDLTNAPQQADYNLLTSSTTSLAIINRPTALSAFNNDTGFYKLNDSPAFGTVTTSGGVTASGIISASDGIFLGNLSAAQLTLSSGAQVAFLNIPGSQVVNLGSDQTKAANAGMIGYQTTTAGAVDVYGAGTAVGSRGVKLWDNVTIPGTLSSGTLTVSGTSTVSGTLTASGVVTASTGVSVPGANVLNLGSDATKETNAGKLGYALLTPGILDVVGGGTSVGTRVVKIWDNVTVPGTFGVSGNTSTGALTVSGTASTGALTSSSITTTGTASTGALTAASVTTGGNLSVTGTASTGALTAASVTATGILTANTGVNVPGTNSLNMGSNVTKETNAGKVGYGLLTTGVLDVVGGGTAAGSRAVKVWDNLTVPGTCSVGGTLTVTGTASTGALTAFSVTTPALTVAGASVYAQINADWNATSGVAQILNKPSSVGGGGGGGAPIPMPVFTSANATGGFTVSASTSWQNDPAYVAWKAFDNDSNSFWVSAASTYQQGPSQGLYLGAVATGGITGEYLQIQTPAPYQLQSYRLFGRSDHYLTSFAILCSSDLSTWTTIDQRNGQDCRTEQSYTAPAQTATFTYFRLVIRQDQTTQNGGNYNYTMVSNFAPVFTTGGTAAVNADWNATSGSSQILNKPTNLTQFTNDLTGSSGGWNLMGSNVLNFGSDVTKETNAGKLGYQTTTVGALDIYGAGTTVGTRGVKLWDNVTIPGTLTVAGSPVFAQVNADWNATSGVAQILNKPSSVGGGGGGTISMPYLTSSTGSGYTVSASSNFNATSLPAWNAFDASTTSAWFSNNGTYDGGNVGGYTGSVNTGGVSGEYLQVSTPSAYQLQSYRLLGTSTHYLSDFTIMGSCDNVTWTTIDTRSGQDCRTEQAYTAPAQTTAFISFRVIIRRDQVTDGGRYAAVANFAPVFLSGTMPTLTPNSGGGVIVSSGGYTVSASSANSNSYAWKAFDADSNTSWVSALGTYASGPGPGTYSGSVTTGGISGEYIQIQTPSALQLQSYRLYGATTHYLSSFSIVASNNLNTWTTIDTKTNQDCRTEQSYTAPAQTAYFGYFRLIITQDQTTQTGSTFTVVTNFAPVFTSGGTGNADWNATSGSAQILNKPTNLTQFTNDLAGASGGWNLTGSNVLNFGSDVTKETNAGKTGYQLTTPGALDVYGAGTAVGSRNIKLWDNVTVPGVSTFTGRVNANGGAVVTGGLTVDGQAVIGGGSTAKRVPWTTVYNNGTVSVSYSVDALGIVRLRGAFSISSNGQVGFTLPTGACPPTNVRSIAADYSTTTYFRIITISTNGAVAAFGGSGFTVCVDDVSFDTGLA